MACKDRSRSVWVLIQQMEPVNFPARFDKGAWSYNCICANLGIVADKAAEFFHASVDDLPSVQNADCLVSEFITVVGYDSARLDVDSRPNKRVPHEI